MQHALSIPSRTLLPFVLVCCVPEASREAPEPSGTQAEARSELIQPAKWWEKLPRPVYANLRQVGVYQGWFEVYELLENTYAIYEPYQFEESISYLVLGVDRGVVIDAGTGIGNIQKVARELTQLPLKAVLTHEHYDHVGGAQYFDEVALYGHPKAVSRLEGGVPNQRARRYVTGDYIWKHLPEGVTFETWAIPSVSPTEHLEDGQIIDLGGRTLEVIYTPGHSPGSVCLLDKANRLLFTGDHFFPGPLYAHADDVDLDDYFASNDELSERIGEYDHVLSGHNDPWVASDVIPRVSEAFETIFAGGGEFSEDDGLRRYRFDGFDVLIRVEQIEERAAQ